MAKKIKPVGNTTYTGMSGQLWKAEIFLSSDRKFYIWIPDYIALLTMGNTSNQRVYSDSYDDVISAAGKIWREYLIASVEEVKVIRYFYARQLPGDGVLNRGFRHDGKVQRGLGIGYQIGYRMKLGMCVYYHDRPYAEYRAAPMNQKLELIDTSQDAFSKIKDWQYVEWTPQLEKFFAETSNALENLIEKVDTYFGENPEQLLDSIKQQKKLLT